MKWWILPIVGGIGYLVYKYAKKSQRGGPPASDIVVEFEENETPHVTSTVTEISDNVRILQGRIDTMCMVLEQAYADQMCAFRMGALPIGETFGPRYAVRMCEDCPAQSEQFFPILADSGVCGKVTEAYWRILLEIMQKTGQYVANSGNSSLVDDFRWRNLQWENTTNINNRIGKINDFLDFYDSYPRLLNDSNLACIWIFLGMAVDDERPAIRRLWEYTR